MPFGPPPRECPGSPVRAELAAGRLVWRVHRRRRAEGSELEGWRFNPTRPATAFAGGRFDPIEDGGPAHLYLGDSEACAVAESFLRLLGVGDRSARLLPRSSREGRDVTWLEVGETLALVDLRGGKALAQVGQDSWLTKSEPVAYPYTREWGRAIRGWCPWADGFVWRSRLDEDLLSYVLFSDAPDRRVLAVRETWRLDEEEGLARLQPILEAYNVTIS